MIYLITQMAVALIIAFLLGLLFGWIFRGFFIKKEKVVITEKNIDNNINIDSRRGDSNLDVNLRSQDLKPHGAFVANEDLSSAAISENQNLDLDISSEEKERLNLGIDSDHNSSNFVAPTEIATKYQVDEIEGIGKTYAGRLGELGINNTEDLITRCGMNISEREEICGHVKVVKEVIGSWTGMADLLRVSGVTGQYAELMNQVGITNVGKLSSSNASDLFFKMKELNDKHHVSPDLPEKSDVEKWIKISSDLSERVKDA